MNNIQELLDKYWEGESSIEEEKVLKDYFNSGNVNADHEVFRDLFVYFSEQNSIKYSGELEFPVEYLNDDSIKVKAKVKNNLLVLTRRFIAVAALFTLLFAVAVLVKNQSSKSTQPEYVYEVEDPDEALEITLKALAMVSGKLDKGTTVMFNGLQNVEKANILR